MDGQGELAQCSAEHSWRKPPGQDPQLEQPTSAVGGEGESLARDSSEQQAGQQPPDAPGMQCASAAAANSGLAPAGAEQAQGAGAERRSGKLKQLFDFLVVIDIEATCDNVHLCWQRHIWPWKADAEQAAAGMN